MKLLVAALLAFSSIPVLAGPTVELGPVRIAKQNCIRIGKVVTCSIKTTADLGGASYLLNFSGDPQSFVPVTESLPILKKAHIWIYLRASGLKEIRGTDQMTGKLESIIIRPWND